MQRLQRRPQGYQVASDVPRSIIPVWEVQTRPTGYLASLYGSFREWLHCQRRSEVGRGGKSTGNLMSRISGPNLICERLKSFGCIAKEETAIALYIRDAHKGSKQIWSRNTPVERLSHYAR